MGNALAEAASVSLEGVTGTPVVVGGQVAHIAKLSINQWIALSRLAVKVMARVNSSQKSDLAARADEFAQHNSQVAALRAEGRTEEADALAATQPTGVTTLDLIGVLEPILDESLLLEVYSLTTGFDSDFLSRTFDMAEFLTCIGALGEHNDVQKIIAAFRSAAQGWGSQLRTPASQPSESSSATG